MTSISSVPSSTTTSPSRSTVPHNTPGAALKGASTAFAKPPLKPKPTFPNYAGAHGALIAATKAGSQQSSPTYNPSFVGSLSRQSTGSSTRHSTASPSPSRWQPRNPSSTDMLHLPVDPAASRTISPSNIAATLAAARHTPMVHKLQQKPSQTHRAGEDMRDTMRGAHSAAQKAAAHKSSSDVIRQQEIASQGSITLPPPPQEKPTDETSIPPTSALVKMFEQARSTNGSDGSKSDTPGTEENTVPQPVILSPTPRRTFSIKKVEDERSVREAAKEVNQSMTGSSAPAPAPKPQRLSSIKSMNSEKQAASQKKVLPTRHVPQSNPINISALRPATDGGEQISPVSSYASAAETVDEVQETHVPKSKPEPRPPRRVRRSQTALGTATSVSPSKLMPHRLNRQNSLQRQMTAEPYMRPTSVPNSAYGRENLQRITAHMTGDSLANAIVGAALASSKNPSRQISPARAAAPPLPRRHERPGHMHHTFFGHKSRTPSPIKQPGKLRQTMRKDESSESSSDDNHHKRKGMFRRKHPNKHHEGARKRWRDAITIHERKRYEGVWAANKGLLISPATIEPHKRFGDESADVLDLVVRDIWARSRLQDHVLEEVWDLVDSRKVGRLTKEEFVVGLWLVDQRLKGRKLPTRVGESVWASVTGAGVKIRYKK
ncbi:hypothetical protein EJ05DRAFT_324145 [Pseudovirgaria hyperparasitica]|uniref:EH domain-containing protein n=1 Tax=Pseudovirgaria hyperparasitica TaxID=470096 RepID=A0A6A6W9L2_9PEZI|nr:uncharacterized protein EJ05DRAFT_324145 [Pseudovirgaria hyperparasitica]KAF2758849.1 hypothetical protein EJ05DRAFT_324145 [Pseudovirgaria hyperparasitica]